MPVIPVPGNVSRRVVPLETKSALRRAPIPTPSLEFKPQAKMPTTLALAAISVRVPAPEKPGTLVLASAKKALRCFRSTVALVIRTTPAQCVPDNVSQRVVTLETLTAGINEQTQVSIVCVWGARLMWGVLGVALCTTPNKQ
jgi:hypothetical protein